MSGISIKKYIEAEKTCSHSKQVENADKSYFICDECGIQLQQIFHCANNNYELVQHNKNNMYEFIDNCVRRLNLPDCMTKEIYDHFMKIKIEKAHKNVVHVASYSIYNYLILVGMARKLKDIVNVTKVHRSDILKYCPKHSIEFNDVKDILENMSLMPFNLTESDRRRILSIHHKFLDNGNSPYGIVAALIKIYSSFINKKIKNKILLIEFQISAMTLFRSKKLIEKEATAILEANKNIFIEEKPNQSLWSNARRKVFASFFSTDENPWIIPCQPVRKNVSKTNKNV